MLQSATGGAVRFPRRIKELLQAALDLRDRHAVGQISAHGLAVSRGRLAPLSDAGRHHQAAALQENKESRLNLGGSPEGIVLLRGAPATP
jgi:hypothetical protein